MKIKCPYCGYDEELSEECLGKVLECPCGKTFAVGQIEVAEEAFVDGSAIIQCPYCGSKNDLPHEAINRNVRCCECDGKFSVKVRRKQSCMIGQKKILFRKRKIANVTAESQTSGSCDIPFVAKENYSHNGNSKSPFSLGGCGCILGLFALLLLIIVGTSSKDLHFCDSVLNSYTNDVLAYNRWLTYNGFSENAFRNYTTAGCSDHYELWLNVHRDAFADMITLSQNSGRYFGPHNWPPGDVMEIMELRKRIYKYQEEHGFSEKHWVKVVQECK